MCDNLLGQYITKCTYSHTVGTQYSESMSEGMSVSQSVEMTMQAQFFKIFSTSMGVSMSTGYDWTHTTDSTKSEQTTITVEAHAPAGNCKDTDKKFFYLFLSIHIR